MFVRYKHHITSALKTMFLYFKKNCCINNKKGIYKKKGFCIFKSWRRGEFFSNISRLIFVVLTVIKIVSLCIKYKFFERKPLQYLKNMSILDSGRHTINLKPKATTVIIIIIILQLYFNSAYLKIRVKCYNNF